MNAITTGSTAGLGLPPGPNTRGSQWPLCISVIPQKEKGDGKKTQELTARETKSRLSIKNQKASCEGNPSNGQMRAIPVALKSPKI